MDTSASQMIPRYLPVNNSFSYFLRTLHFFVHLDFCEPILLDETQIMLLLLSACCWVPLTLRLLW